MTKKERLEWIDIAKGIGIIGIILIHLCQVEIPWIRTFFLFLLPLFFFLSGYLYKKNIPICDFIIRKALSLLIPYFAVFFLLAPFLIPDFGIYPIKLYIWGGIRINNQILNPTFVPMWFLTTFFLTQVIYHILNTMFKLKHLHWLCLIIYITSFFFNKSLPWGLNMVLTTIPFFHLGRIYKDHKDSINKYRVFLCGLGILGLIIAFFIPEIRYDIYALKYGIPIISFIFSCASIYLVIEISKLMIRNKVLSMIFSELGKASLVLMYIHFPIAIILNKLSLFNPPLIKSALLVILIGYLIYVICMQFKTTRILFLGKGISKEQIHTFFKRLKYNI